MPEATALEPAAPTAVIDRGVLPVTDVLARVARVQEVMQSVMKKDVHFGTIPGTDKPMLYKPGAELLCMTFRIAPKIHIEDLSTEDERRYRLLVRGINQVTGEFLGEGIGTCSSNEEKYRWRATYIDEEWEATPEDRRRTKWFKKRNEKAWSQRQVRTSPSDVDNTILAMAAKRALVHMTRVVTACSDIFGQDLEDLSEELREQLAGEEGSQPPEPKKEPVRRSEKERQARERPPGEPVPAPGDVRQPPAATGAGAPSATGEKPQHFLNARVLATQWVTKKDEDPFAEISIGIHDGQRIAATHVMLTRDRNVYKLAQSLEDQPTNLKVTFHLGKRRDKSVSKVLDALESMS